MSHATVESRSLRNALFPAAGSARGVAQQGLQPLARHVERGRDHLREPERNVPVQRGGGHQRSNPERRVHVPAEPVERDIVER